MNPDKFIKGITDIIGKFAEPEIEEPYCDVYDYDNKYIIYLDIPGCFKNTISINIESDLLIIKAERDLDQTKCIIRERPKNFGLKKIKLPVNVLDSTPTVTYNDGVLKLVFVKSVKINRTIPVSI